MKTTKNIPQFTSEAEERIFWEEHDSFDLIDWSKASKNLTFTNLKPSTETISLRLPKHLLEQIKRIANSKDVPYQSLIKMMLAEQVEHTYSYVREKNRTYASKASK